MDEPVVVDATIAAHTADAAHGNRYGIDWIWHHDRLGYLHASQTLDCTQATARAGWMPIETAPKDGTVIDLWVPEFGRLTNEWFDTEDNSWCFPGKPTHWMPIPAPPAGDG